MIRGYRWIETGNRIWQLEGPSGSRRFHGCVRERFAYVGGRVVTDGVFSWYTTGGPSGEASTKREAMDNVEGFVRVISERDEYKARAEKAEAILSEYRDKARIEGKIYAAESAIATAGIEWWNSLSHAEQRAALDEAGGNASPADAYRWYLRHAAAIAKATEPSTGESR